MYFFSGRTAGSEQSSKTLADSAGTIRVRIQLQVFFISSNSMSLLPVTLSCQAEQLECFLGIFVLVGLGECG